MGVFGDGVVAAAVFADDRPAGLLGLLPLGVADLVEGGEVEVADAFDEVVLGGLVLSERHAVEEFFLLVGLGEFVVVVGLVEVFGLDVAGAVGLAGAFEGGLCFAFAGVDV